MINDFCPDCVDDLCADVALDAIDYTNYCEVNNDELIDEIFYTDRAHPLSGDPDELASFGTRLSNTSNGSGTTENVAHPIRRLKVIDAEKPKGTLNYKNNRAGDSAKLGRSPRQITGIIDDDSDEMYELMRSLQCNGNIKMWYKAGKHIYGGQDGINAVIKPTYGIVNDTNGLAHSWSFAIDWTSKCEEPRFVSAI